MSRLSPEGRAFLEATRGLDEPSELDRRRIRAKTLAALAVGGHDGGAPQSPGPAGAPGPVTTGAAASGVGSGLGGGGASLGWGGGAMTGALLALAVLGGWAAKDFASGHEADDGRGGLASEARTRGAPAPDPREASAPSTTPTALVTPPRPSGERRGDGAPVASTASKEGAPASRPAPGAPPAPDETAAPEAPPVAAPPQPSAPPAPVANAIDMELAALHEAQEALRAGRPDEAVRVLDRFAATHASGALEEERRAARIVAACKAGVGPSARADAERFLRERPDAVLGERIRAACLQKESP